MGAERPDAVADVIDPVIPIIPSGDTDPGSAEGCSLHRRLVGNGVDVQREDIAELTNRLLRERQFLPSAVFKYADGHVVARPIGSITEPQRSGRIRLSIRKNSLCREALYVTLDRIRGRRWIEACIGRNSEEVREAADFLRIDAKRLRAPDRVPGAAAQLPRFCACKRRAFYGAEYLAGCLDRRELEGFT